MNTMQRRAVLLSLIYQMHSKGSGCGETHIQKATYFLQELLGVPLDLNVILYRHGPYSFDLSTELTALRAEQMLAVVPRDRRYRPTLVVTDVGQQFILLYSKTVGQYKPAIEFVAKRLGGKNVKELERLATALFVLRMFTDISASDGASKVTELKPHVSLNEAAQSLQELQQIQLDSSHLVAVA
jgi:uncharacterized protein YwgA